jgi:hypothetical protein
MLKMDSKTRKMYCKFKRQEMGKKVKIYTTEIPVKSDALVRIQSKNITSYNHGPFFEYSSPPPSARIAGSNC